MCAFMYMYMYMYVYIYIRASIHLPIHHPSINPPILILRNIAGQQDIYIRKYIYKYRNICV